MRENTQSGGLSTIVDVKKASKKIDGLKIKIFHKNNKRKRMF